LSSISRSGDAPNILPRKALDRAVFDCRTAYDEVAQDLATVALDPEIAGLLVDDIARQMRLLFDSGVAHPMDHSALARPSFILAARHGITLYDAQTVILAETTRLPLLVADRDLYDVLQRIAIERPMFRLLWLPQYLDELDLP
jgi:predicted nucleic acid-binding protein